MIKDSWKWADGCDSMSTKTLDCHWFGLWDNHLSLDISPDVCTKLITLGVSPNPSLILCVHPIFILIVT